MTQPRKRRFSPSKVCSGKNVHFYHLDLRSNRGWKKPRISAVFRGGSQLSHPHTVPKNTTYPSHSQKHAFKRTIPKNTPYLNTPHYVTFYAKTYHYTIQYAHIYATNTNNNKITYTIGKSQNKKVPSTLVQ